ncbi:hypothetical protein [Actinomadura rupiterrae]|uniref:hypothetical protein n=1 Tax=Actinomadura rupiterrae TaxID=559627 RepID=UPI0020A40E75|nr:hypothetical protein [Actinomadura rupiterrae]MCP2334953.1 hypothetical protein [Actinomadura rupiterrae]
MADLSRVLRADARRARPLAGAAVLAASGIAAAWPTLLPGVAYWDNSIVALVNAVRVMGPVAAGFAALAGARERRLDYLRVVTARSPITGVLLDLALLVMVALASYAVVVGVIVVRTVLRQEAGQPDLLGLTAASAALALHVTAGYLAGRLVPRPTTALVVTAAAALWAAARLPGTSWWSLLPPAALHRVELFTCLSPGVLADQTVWAATLAVALALAYCWWVTRRAVLLLGVAAALVLAGGATVRLHGTHGRAVEAAPAADVCHDWPLRVCVHPALAPALPALEEALTPLAARLADTPAAFTRVEQRPVPGPARVAHGLVRLYLPGELGAGFTAGVLRDVRDGLVGPRTCATRTRGARQYESLVDAWLLGNPAPAISDRSVSRRFGLWDEEDRRSWLRTHFTDYRKCSLGASDFSSHALAKSKRSAPSQKSGTPAPSPKPDPSAKAESSAKAGPPAKTESSSKAGPPAKSESSSKSESSEKAEPFREGKPSQKDGPAAWPRDAAEKEKRPALGVLLQDGQRGREYPLRGHDRTPQTRRDHAEA